MNVVELLQFTAQIVPQRCGPDSIIFKAGQRPVHTGSLALLITIAEAVESNPGPAWGRQQELTPPKIQGGSR